MPPLHTAARVLLIAHPSRQRELAPWLSVEGESVRYALELCAPADMPDKLTCDVVVIDGGSFVDPRERTRVLRAVGNQRYGFTTSLYIVSRLPFEKEIDEAWAWVNDLIDPGWSFPERLRRRVQTLALAPWRRSMALRLRAEQEGDSILRVLAPEASPVDEHRTGVMRRLDRAMPFVLAERAWDAGGDTPKLVAEAFHEGRRVGVTSVQERTSSFVERLEVDLAEGLRALSPKGSTHPGTSPSPAVIAARHVLEVVCSGFESVADEELAGIERHRAGGGS